MSLSPNKTDSADKRESHRVATPLLFTPITLAGLTARNRIVVSPMCQYSSEDGGPTNWHLHLGKFAMGGAGIVFCEETAVEQKTRKTYGCAASTSTPNPRG